VLSDPEICDRAERALAQYVKSYSQRQITQDYARAGTASNAA